MQHLDEGTIHAWLDGALSADEAARVELHVTSCETCSDAVAEARGLIAASSRILTALDDVPRVRGARGDRASRRDRAWFLVRSRIAAVIAMVVAGGALALAVRRDSPAPLAFQPAADSSIPTTVAIDVPAAEPAPPPNAERVEQVHRDAPASRGAVGALQGRIPGRSIERDLASERAAAVSAPTVAQLREGVSPAAAAPPATPAPRTDDTARVLADVVSGNRVADSRLEAEGQTSAAAKLGGAFEVRRSAAEAAARFAEPAAAPQARLRASSDPTAPRLLSEERFEDNGGPVVRRVYRVEGMLVTLDERQPLADSTIVLERQRRMNLLELEQRRAPADSASPTQTSISWVDARGATFTLSAAAPQAQLERFRKLLGYE